MVDMDDNRPSGAQRTLNKATVIFRVNRPAAVLKRYCSLICMQDVLLLQQSVFFS